MSRYLQRYVGTYRVLAEYEEEYGDFPRSVDGSIEDSFCDLYILCDSKIRIIHQHKDILFAMIPSLKKTSVLTKEMYSKTIGQVPKRVMVIKGEEQEIDENYEVLLEELSQNKIIYDYEVLDGEAYIYFRAKDIDFFADIFGARTSGCKIQPFSTKNLPKAKYKIPDDDLIHYDNIMKNLTLEQKLSMNTINKDFNKIITNKKGKAFDILKEMRAMKVKKKEFVHAIGLWEDYIKFLQDKF